MRLGDVLVLEVGKEVYREDARSIKSPWYATHLIQYEVGRS